MKHELLSESLQHTSSYKCLCISHFFVSSNTICAHVKPVASSTTQSGRIGIGLFKLRRSQSRQAAFTVYNSIDMEILDNDIVSDFNESALFLVIW